MAAPAPPANLNKTHQDVAATTSTLGSGSHAVPATTSSQPTARPAEYSSFAPPLDQNSLPSFSIVIEFCDRCRWVHRATWTQTELFVTFGEKNDSSSSSSTAQQTPTVKAITLIPMTKEETAGRFRVWVYGNVEQSPSGKSSAVCVYDRKVKGGFPELKELKQLIRDVISPGQSLGHSDNKTTHGQGASKGVGGRDTWGTGHEPNTGTATTD